MTARYDPAARALECGWGRVARGETIEITDRGHDAIHLATAHQLGDEVRALVTYDVRMAEAARQLDWRVVSPE